MKTHLHQLWSPISNPHFAKDKPEKFSWIWAWISTVLKFNSPGIHNFLTIQSFSCKQVEWDQAQARSRSVESRPPLKVFSRNFELFDSLKFLLNSIDSLVVWSPTNVGKKIELLWGQIEATQFMYLKFQLHVSLNILGVRVNWGQIRAQCHFYFEIVSLFLILVMVEGGPVQWGPPEKKTGATAPVVRWHVSQPHDLAILF